jgi:hypothetical protein
MPAWPTLYPLLMHYKRTPNFPYGTGDTSAYKHDQNIINDVFPDGLKTRELYSK